MRMSALRNPNFRTIFAGHSTSVLGDAIAPIAIAFAVLDGRGTARDLGLILAARVLSMSLLAVVGGVWGDRLPRQRVVVMSSLVSGLAQGTFALTLINGVFEVWLLVLLQLVNGAAIAFFRPASTGLVQESVDRSDLQSANALISLALNLSSIVGPAIAGGMIAVAGAPWALLIDALTFFVSAVLYSRAALPPRKPARRSTLIHEALAGLREARAQPWILTTISMFCLVQLLIIAPYSILGPTVSQFNYGGPMMWVIVTAVAGVGAVTGDMFAMSYRPSRPLVAVGILALGMLPIILGLAFHPPIVVMAACGFLFGFCMCVPNIYWATCLQQHVPEELMARVSALDWMGSTVLRPAGLAAVVPASALLGTQTILVGAVIVVAVMFLTYSQLSVVRSVKFQRADSTV